MKKLVDIYPYKVARNERLFLICKRSEHVIYAGQWRIIGGKCTTNETRAEAAIRELKEETGMYPKKIWTIPSLNQFYEAKTDQIHHIPAFAAEISDSEIILNHEHVSYRWLPAREAAANLVWPEQKRLLLLTEQILKENSVLEEWIIPVDGSQ